MRCARAALLVVLALLPGCEGEAPAPELGAPPVMVRRATAHDVVDRVEATGQLLAPADATVAAQVEGQVTDVLVDEGSAVASGQPVLEIDPARRRLELDDARAGLRQAQAQLDEAGRQARRVESLGKAGAASEARVDEVQTALTMARTAHAAAEARVGLAQRALEDATVVAPFDGFLARRLVNVGEFVNAGQALFRVVDLDPIEVELFLSELDSSRVSLGQDVEVHVASFPDEVFHATVSVVSPTMEAATRTRRVKALLENPEGLLLPGSFARVDLGVAERHGVVMVPKEALLLRSDGSVVFRLGADSGHVERVQVQVGAHRGELVELRGGIDAGDFVVVRGQADLVDGSPVSLRNEDGTPFDLASEPAAPVEGGGE